MNDMSFEDALHYLGTADPLTAQQEGYFREGQTWTEDQIGCEVQVVGGTHYFTPIAQERYRKLMLPSMRFFIWNPCLQQYRFLNRKPESTCIK